MGIEFDTQMLDTPQGHKVKAQIWDTAGQERFARVLLPTYFRKAKGVILVYDITNIKSFESLSERWMTQLNDHSNSDDLAKLLVGNKSDLTSESSGGDNSSSSSREVTTEKAMSFCQEYGMEFLETSAKSGNNVLTAFEKLIGIVHDRALNNNSSSSSSNNSSNNNKDSNKNNNKSSSGGGGSGGQKGNNNNKSEADDDGTVNLNASGNEGSGDDSGACGC